VLSMLTRIGLVAAAVVVVVAGTAAVDSPAADPSTPSIYVTYSPSCTFTMTVDPGLPITSANAPGPTLPPGPYQVVIFMPNPAEGYTGCTAPRFTFTGPGVNGLTEFRGEELVDEHLRPVLQPSSTYVAQDENAPGQSRKVFTTAASGSSSVLLGPAGATSGGATKGSVQPELVGSARLPYRGRLVARVNPAGKATLLRGGRKVGSLKVGEYVITVVDAAKRAGFFIQRGNRRPVTVTGLAFVGKRTRPLALRPGSWTLFSKVGGPTRFTVVP